MLILGIDLEGMNENLVEAGVNLQVDRVTEIGAVLWDTRINSPIRIFSELIDERDRIPMTEEVIELTGIDDKLLKDHGLKSDEIKMALERLALLIKKADYLMAHNGEKYDRPMLTAMFKRYGLEIPTKTWIDTQNDIEYPRKITHKSMAALEHAHGFINPFPHRAVTDVLSMLKIASHYDYARMATIASGPKIKIVASLKAPNWKDKNQVDEFNRIKNKVARARFQWDPESKQWYKIVPKLHIDEGILNFDFDWSTRV
ncbi:3'-5' exonuclease [Bacteriovorax sp. Seq25_V]|uniref:3'-5' exonuclease n=1 Tax=Bacteriovorax sp. Seq25_V TaxID=1201288 RepID=UPI00038A3ED0|nr:3'-5' exonuclease [Bacteriovorax sp. Seq25_V]EQC43984.1 exonuclease [Bacteriovorax sp. Seq25_V]